MIRIARGTGVTTPTIPGPASETSLLGALGGLGRGNESPFPVAPVSGLWPSPVKNNLLVFLILTLARCCTNSIPSRHNRRNQISLGLASLPFIGRNSAQSISGKKKKKCFPGALASVCTWWGCSTLWGVSCRPWASIHQPLSPLDRPLLQCGCHFW